MMKIIYETSAKTPPLFEIDCISKCPTGYKFVLAQLGKRRSSYAIRIRRHRRSTPLVFDLAIREQTFGIAGGLGNAMTVNDSIPGPLLEWHEGRDVILNLTNNMRHSTSIHWHGILLPFEMDGVPGVAFQGIDPGETFRYQFPVKQNGTYWYHSHTGLQEQSGVYGPLVIHPKAEEPVDYDRDYVVMLTDWTFENPLDVMAELKKMSDYCNYQQFTQADLYGADDMSSGDAWTKKLVWDRMRMMPTDIADVNGSTYTYLMNGLHPAGNWTGLFNSGECECLYARCYFLHRWGSAFVLAFIP